MALKAQDTTPTVIKYTQSGTSPAPDTKLTDRLKPMISKLSTKPNDNAVKTFYDEPVLKIVKSKLDKFTYGDEVELGGVVPIEEEECDRQSKEKKIKGLLRKGVVKSTDTK